jgi:glycosyltransferase involved in cell wall biosynthesis
MIIVVQTFNRGNIAKFSLSNLKKTKRPSDTIICWDDASTKKTQELQDAWKCADRLILLEKNIGIEQLRWEQFQDLPDDEYIYFTDSDALHDKRWRKVIDACKEEAAILSLYRSRLHNLYKPFKGVCESHRCPGISMLIPPKILKQIKKLKFNKTVWDRQCWDNYVSDLFKCYTTYDSFVEHIGAGGIHTAGFDDERAVNPTVFLYNLREDFMLKIGKV